MREHCGTFFGTLFSLCPSFVHGSCNWGKSLEQCHQQLATNGLYFQAASAVSQKKKPPTLSVAHSSGGFSQQGLCTPRQTSLKWLCPGAAPRLPAVHLTVSLLWGESWWDPCEQAHDCGAQWGRVSSSDHYFTDLWSLQYELCRVLQSRRELLTKCWEEEMWVEHISIFIDLSSLD